MSATTLENPYESPQAADLPQSERPSGTPTPGLALTVARFHRERGLMATLNECLCGLAVIWLVSAALANSRPQTYAAIAIGGVAGLLSYCYRKPEVRFLYVSVVICVAINALLLIVFGGSFMGVVPYGSPVHYLIAAIGFLFVSFPLMLLALRILMGATAISRSGYPLSVTSLDVIADQKSVGEHITRPADSAAVN